MVEPGNYLGILKGGQVCKTKTKGSLQVALAFNITQIASGGEWQVLPEFFDRTLFLSLSGGAVPYTEDKLLVLGFNGNYGNMEFTVEQVSLNCKHGSYDGQAREEWELAEWRGGGSPELTPASDNDIKLLSAQWKAKHPTPAGKRPPEPRAEGDGTPF